MTDVQALVHRACELQEWQAVPGRVATLYKAAAPVAATIKKILKNLKSSDRGYVFWHPEDRIIWAVLGDGDDEQTHQRWHNALKAVKGVSSVKTVSEVHPPNQDEWVMVKRAAAPLGFIGKPMEWAGKLTGGPSPLTNALVGGLLTGGLGYGTGWLLEHLMPKRFVDRGKLRKTLGVLGAGLGAVPGAWQWAANSANARQAGSPMGISSLWTPHEKVPTVGGNLEATAHTSGPQGGVWDPDEGIVKTNQLAAMREALDLPGLSESDLGIIKQAVMPYQTRFDPSYQHRDAGGTGLKSVPMDAFNRAVWNDVRRGMTAGSNPFGTKSPWGDNTQGMHTSPAVGALATGMVGGVQQMFGNPPSIPVGHLAKGFMQAGIDAAAANIGSKVLGALVGVSPPVQNRLQDIGLWGGLLRGTMASMLGGR